MNDTSKKDIPLDQNGMPNECYEVSIGESTVKITADSVQLASPSVTLSVR